MAPEDEATFYADVARCAATLGRRSFGRAAIQRLACDVLLLVHGIRDAVLWDFTATDEDGDESAPCAFLTALCESYPPAHGLILVKIGPSLFLAAADALALRLSRPLPGAEGGPDLVAVDGILRAPRLCDASECRVVCTVLSAVAAELCTRLGVHQRDAPSHVTPSQRPAPPLLVQLCCPEPAASMVAVHGWLLGYPVVYCYASDELGSRTSCLGGQPLHVVQLTAAAAVASLGGSNRKGGSRAPQQAPPPAHLVCSFSLPAIGQDGECALEQDPRLTRWRHEINERFASQSRWQLEELRVETRVQEHIVL